MHPLPNSFIPWRGTIGRGWYFGAGVGLMALKYNIDRLVGALYFDRTWFIWNYFEQIATSDRMPDEKDLPFYLTLLAISLPFLWLGLSLTSKRLRDAGQHPLLALLFFLPFVNLLLFLFLSIAPSASADEKHPPLLPDESPILRQLGHWIPQGSWGAATIAVLITALLACATTAFSVSGLQMYGWGLFVGIPFVSGLAAVLIHSWHAYRSFWQSMLVAQLSVAVSGLVLLAFAFEGVVCLVMAAPIACVLAALGGAFGYLLAASARQFPRSKPHALALVPALPFLIFAEFSTGPTDRIGPVVTELHINATPEQVWPNVIGFSRIPDPTELIFKTGIAYPTHAEIDDEGVGAVRYCHFTTGPFVEPVTTWQPPEVLAFTVSAYPSPMNEITPYGKIDTHHLHDYFKSDRGELRLIRQGDGTTILRGTTWYSHDLWPTAYWRFMTDHIVHSIHLRVLSHIKNLSESPPAEHG